MIDYVAQSTKEVRRAYLYMCVCSPVLFVMQSVVYFLPLCVLQTKGKCTNKQIVKVNILAVDMCV